MKKKILLLNIFFLFSAVTHSYEQVYFNDGGSHIIDYLLDAEVIVDKDNPGTGTRLELVDGGGIAPGQGYGNIVAHQDSRITVSGGTMGWTLWANDRSRVQITGGYLRGSLSTGSMYTAFMSGGSVTSAVANRNGSIDVSGGIIRRSLETQGTTSATVRGGEIAKINCLDSSRISIWGGTITQSLIAGYYNDASSLITIYGDNFAINGLSIMPGEYASSYSYNGLITGTLKDGSLMNTSFELNGNSDILFIPEPGTVAMLGLGCLLIRKRRK